MSEPWMAYVYQYVVGGLFFFGVTISAIVTGALQPKTKEGRGTILLLIAGFVIFAVVHAGWTYYIVGY